jgi:hypothetical protein
MNSIKTVAENLRNTIDGKKALLKGLKSPSDIGNEYARQAMIATREYLEINIEELERILHDVEQCLPTE